MIAHFKKTNVTTVIEIGLGVFAAIMVIRLLGVLFGRSSSLFSAEDDNAEDLENFGGRMRAKAAGRRAKRDERKSTRAANEDTRTKRAIAEGKKRGSKKRLPEYEEEPEVEQEEEEMQEEQEMLEMAEYFDSLDAEDIENMDAEEAEEYAEYLEMLDAA